jgi:acyl-CoA synthetase (NDP forming)
MDGPVRTLLHAEGVVIVGASDDPAKASGRTLHYLKKYGYAGGIYPVNPNRTTVQGVPAYATAAEVPGTPDLAVIVVPAPAVPDAIRAVGARGVGVAIVFAAGFAEAGPDGERAQEELLATAREAGVRLLGPNCVGSVGAGSNLTAAFMSGLDQDRFTLADDGVAFVTQSGAMGAFVLSMAQSSGLGLGRFVSTGNEADITLPEVVEGLVEDPTTSVVLGYVEGVRDPDGFRRALRRAREKQVPVVLMKVGRSQRGAAAAQSHTGALVGADAVYDGLFEQYGVYRAQDISTLLDLGRVFAARRYAAGPRVSIVTLSGGAGVLMTDAAEDLGLDVSPWSERWQARAAAILPPFASATNPIDVTGAIVADQEMLRDSVVVALENPESDVVVLMIGNLDREEAKVIDYLRHLRDTAETTDKPLVVVWVGGSGRPITELSRAGIPTFDEPLRAMRAVAALVDWSGAIGRGSGLVSTKELGPAVRPDPIGALDEVAGKSLLASYGVRVVREVEAATPDEAVDASTVTGLPAVVKLLSDEVTHKSEHGFVAVGLSDREQVAMAAERILDRAKELGIGDRRLVVQEMVTAETELLLGMRHDPVFGPVIALGIGGVLTEVAADVQVRLPPLSQADVTSMVGRLRGAALLDGPRGRAAVDRDALTETVLGFSRLVTERAAEFESIEINPLLVDSAGLPIAVDALVIRRSPSPE